MALPQPYSVLIRTHNSAATLPFTLDSLRAQTVPPSQYVFIDSGSTDATLDLVPKGSICHAYVGDEFNYAASLNQGLQYVSTEFVLIISSHLALENAEAVAFGLDVLQSSDNIGAAYFTNLNDGSLRHERIDAAAFDGFNGLWNACSLIRVKLLRERGFLTHVFTAEDQEWARWLMFSRGRATARISGAGCISRNAKKDSLRKLTNEYVAVAYYSNRTLLGLLNLRRIAASAILPKGGLRLRNRLFKLWLLTRLISCHFVEPRAKSRYF